MESLRTSPSKMMDVMKYREVWRLNFELLPLATLTEKRAMKKENKTNDIPNNFLTSGIERKFRPLTKLVPVP